MAVGDQHDMFLRLKDNLVSWFGSNTPVLDALLMGCALTDSYIYDLIQDANLQTRIKTATGFYLDYISLDYFGTGILQLPRHFEENDASFRNRILANLITEKGTRKGMENVLTNLTGRKPIIIEGANTYGIGAYDQNLYYDQYGGMGWLQPYTAIIYVFRVQPTGLTGFFGFDSTGFFGFDFYNRNAWVSLNDEVIIVSDQDILDAIERTKVYGTFIYTYFLD